MTVSYQFCASAVRRGIRTDTDMSLLCFLHRVKNHHMKIPLELFLVTNCESLSAGYNSDTFSHSVGYKKNLVTDNKQRSQNGEELKYKGEDLLKLALHMCQCEKVHWCRMDQT